MHPRRLLETMDVVGKVGYDSAFTFIYSKRSGTPAAAKENQVPVKFVHSDLFKEISGSYDMIVSNPPYIPSKVIETLMPEVRDHEPIKALDGKEDGLYFYRRITEESVAYLKPGGYLLYEIGHDQGEAVSSYMRENGFDEIEVIRDLAGLDRVVRGRR